MSASCFANFEIRKHQALFNYKIKFSLCQIDQIIITINKLPAYSQFVS